MQLLQLNISGMSFCRSRAVRNVLACWFSCLMDIWLVLRAAVFSLPSAFIFAISLPVSEMALPPQRGADIFLYLSAKVYKFAIFCPIIL